VALESVRALSRAGAAPRTGGGSVVLERRGAPAVPRGPFGATDLNTSEYLAGSVSVNVVLVESDGTIEPQSESWTADREAEVGGRMAAGLEWVRLQEPQAALSFVYPVFAGRTDPRARTGYEPIRHAADPSGSTGEDLWVKDVLRKLGYGVG